MKHDSLKWIANKTAIIFRRRTIQRWRVNYIRWVNDSLTQTFQGSTFFPRLFSHLKFHKKKKTMLRVSGSFLRSAIANLKKNNVVVLKNFLLIKKTKQRLDFHKGFSYTMWQPNADQTKIQNALLLFLNILTDATATGGKLSQQLQ